MNNTIICGKGIDSDLFIETTTRSRPMLICSTGSIYV